MKAIDSDFGNNAEVIYSISTLTDPEFSQMFSVDPISGWLKLAQELDFENHKQASGTLFNFLLLIFLLLKALKGVDLHYQNLQHALFKVGWSREQWREKKERMPAKLARQLPVLQAQVCV